MTDDRLRHASAALGADETPRAGCPTDEAIWNAVAGSASPEATRSIVLHTVECAVCAESWRVAAALHREAGLRRAATRRRFPRIAAAAAVAGLALISVGLWSSRAPSTPEGEPAVRSGESSTDAKIVALDGTDRILRRDAPVLRWRAPESARFDVRVTTVDLRVLFTAKNIADSSVTLPETALADLEEGVTLLWSITATLPDGQEFERAFVATLEGAP